MKQCYWKRKFKTKGISALARLKKNKNSILNIKEIPDSMESYLGNSRVMDLFLPVDPVIVIKIFGLPALQSNVFTAAMDGH